MRLRDPLHAQAREQRDLLHRAGAKLRTSVPVVIETFTFLDRNANRDVALAWRESIYELQTMEILPCELRDLEESWKYFRRADLHKLSAVDATSLAIMTRARIRLAYTFDHHFAVVGSRLVTQSNRRRPVQALRSRDESVKSALTPIALDRIELDISIEHEQIALGFGEARAEASFPQRTAAPVGPVHVLGITFNSTLTPTIPTIYG